MSHSNPGEAIKTPTEPASTSTMLTLALHKLNHTTLRILHSGSFTPFKLRSCKTIGQLFDNVANICGLTQSDQRKTVKTLQVTFSWLPETDTGRTMLLKEDVEDSFEVFLETINEAPCWETDFGRCIVPIEVVQRTISNALVKKTWSGR